MSPMNMSEEEIAPPIKEEKSKKSNKSSKKEKVKSDRKSKVSVKEEKKPIVSDTPVDVKPPRLPDEPLRDKRLTETKLAHAASLR